jgi:hypothetical protein
LTAPSSAIQCGVGCSVFTHRILAGVRRALAPAQGWNRIAAARDPLP